MALPLSPRALVEALLPLNGPLSLVVVYQAARQVGLADQPVRLSIRRLVSMGEIEQHGRGTDGTIALTDAGRERLLRDRIGLRLAFAQDAGEMRWDGKWHLYAMSSSESNRSVRDVFRRDVHSLGAVSISTGLYLSPHDISEYFSADTEPYLVIATATRVAVRGLTDQRDIAEALWPANQTVEPYEALAEALTANGASGETLYQQLLLAEALEAALRNDPLLPIELRQAPWLPSEVRLEWLERWKKVTAEKSEFQVYQGWLESPAVG